MGSRCSSAVSSRAMPKRMPMNASAAIGTLIRSRTCHGATASTRPPTVGPIASPTRPDGRDERHRADAQHVALEQPEGECDRPRCRHRGRDAHQRAHDDQLLGGVHERGGEARQAEQDEPDEHHASSSEPVGDGSEREHEPSERDRIGAGHPLQPHSRCVQFVSDRRQRDIQDRVVEHLEQEDRGQARERDPCIAQRARGAPCTDDLVVCPKGGHGTKLTD